VLATRAVERLRQPGSTTLLSVRELRFTETDFKYSADGNLARRIWLTGSAAIILGTTDQERNSCLHPVVGLR
jgi:hypothetical protein